MTTDFLLQNSVISFIILMFAGVLSLISLACLIFYYNNLPCEKQTILIFLIQCLIIILSLLTMHNMAINVFLQLFPNVIIVGFSDYYDFMYLSFVAVSSVVQAKFYTCYNFKETFFFTCIDY